MALHLFTPYPAAVHRAADRHESQRRQSQRAAKLQGVNSIRGNLGLLDSTKRAEPRGGGTSAKLALICSALFISAARAESCAEFAALVEQLDTSQAQTVNAKPGEPTSFVDLFRECDLRNTFAGRPVPPKHRCSSNRNNVTSMRLYPDGTLVAVAKAAVDADGSPPPLAAEGSSKSITWFEPGNQSLNAELIPYVVIPLPGDGFSFQAQTNIGKGDIAVVFFQHRCSFAIVGDGGSYNQFGEISLAAHADLGNYQCRDNRQPCQSLIGPHGDGLSLSSGVTYVIFPHTFPSSWTRERARAVAIEMGSGLLKTFLITYSARRETDVQ
jgi:hypothetical protein